MNLETMKSIATTVVLLLALLQVLEMAQVQGSLRLLPVEKQRLRWLHRGGGIVALLLMFLIAAACVFGEGLRFYPLRVGIHAVAGSLAIAVLLTKVVITRRARHLLRFNKALGGIAGVLILVTFAAGVVWYYL
ncbi:MAG: DUF6529 family protein [Anaerolineae bacterium]|nr:DUF6529 family protein [Anaerolineae bacterium]